MSNKCEDCADHPVSALMELMDHLGVKGLAQSHAGRCWEHQIDPAWRVAINPNRIDTKTATGVSVVPFGIYVEFHGWPAAVFTFHGDGEFAAGSAANAETFAAACRAATRSART